MGEPSFGVFQLLVTNELCFIILVAWSFCVPLEIAWRAKFGTRAIGCRPLD